jgi:ribosome-associated heat shock protein Hsp15
LSATPADDVDANDSGLADAHGAAAARLDRWLWAVRVCKTRPLATEACRRGAVEINGLTAKPARPVHNGDVVIVRQPTLTRTLKVVGVPASRVGAKLLPNYLVDLTPPEEFERQRLRGLESVLTREKGAGRPTKRDRRSLDRFFG